MNPLTRFLIARSRTKLEKLLAEDKAARTGKTTMAMMEDIVRRGHDIAVLRHHLAQLEGAVVVDEDSGGFDDRIPSGVHCPTAKDEK